MVKHVFRKTSWGRLYYEGEYVKETDKTVTYKRSLRHKETRIDKHLCIVLETNDPDSVLNAFVTEWERHVASIDAARETLKGLEANQQKASLLAAIATAENHP